MSTIKKAPNSATPGPSLMLDTTKPGNLVSLRCVHHSSDYPMALLRALGLRWLAELVKKLG